MKFDVIPSYSLNEKRSRAISNLLSEAFSSYPAGQTYYKQVPCFHAVIRDGKNVLAHAAIHHRVIYVDETPLRIFGLSDICVAKSHQNQGFGKTLIAEIESLAQSGKVDFLALITDELAFYLKQGFKKIDGRARWILMGSNRMLGMQERTLTDTFYVKPVVKEKWPKGLIDFAGPLF